MPSASRLRWRRGSCCVRRSCCDCTERNRSHRFWRRSGLGEATARDLAAHGGTVVIADLNEERGKPLADELGGVFVRTDVSDEDQVQAAVDAAVATGKPLRVVVNSAGIGWASRTVDRDGSPHDLASYRKVIDVNLIGTFNLMRIGAAAVAKTEPVDADGQRGVVINTASVAAWRARPARWPTRRPRAASSA